MDSKTDILKIGVVPWLVSWLIDGWLWCIIQKWFIMCVCVCAVCVCSVCAWYIQIKTLLFFQGLNFIFHSTGFIRMTLQFWHSFQLSILVLFLHRTSYHRLIIGSMEKQHCWDSSVSRGHILLLSSEWKEQRLQLATEGKSSFLNCLTNSTRESYTSTMKSCASKIKVGTHPTVTLMSPAFREFFKAAACRLLVWCLKNRGWKKVVFMCFCRNLPSLSQIHTCHTWHLASQHWGAKLFGLQSLGIRLQILKGGAPRCSFFDLWIFSCFFWLWFSS